MRTLLTAGAISERVDRLGEWLSADYAGKPLTVVAILSGSVVLVADLMRRITVPHQVGFVRASSYRGTATTGEELTISLDGLPDIAGRHVLIVDDIFDSGRTLEAIAAAVSAGRPASVRSLALLWKTARRQVERVPDYFGFEIPDAFVVGYGLDYNGDFRHLPDVCVLEPGDL